MPTKKMTARELARKMVVVSKKEDDWEIMVADRARKEEVTRMSFMDFLDRWEAMGIARLIRRAIVDALEQAKVVRAAKSGRKGTLDAWVVTMNPPFSEIRATWAKRGKRKGVRSKSRVSGRAPAQAKTRALGGARDARVIAFPAARAKS